jgi:hypothetical protein
MTPVLSVQSEGGALRRDRGVAAARTTSATTRVVRPF